MYLYFIRISNFRISTNKTNPTDAKVVNEMLLKTKLNSTCKVILT